MYSAATTSGYDRCLALTVQSCLKHWDRSKESIYEEYDRSRFDYYLDTRDRRVAQQQNATHARKLVACLFQNVYEA